VHGSTRRGVSVVALLVACGTMLHCASKSTEPIRLAVSYTLSLSGSVVVDSLLYDDGHGTLVRVVPVPSGWGTLFAVVGGGSVQAVAWGTAAGAGSAKLKVTWTQSGVSSSADSSTARPSAPGHFTLSIARRLI